MNFEYIVEPRTRWFHLPLKELIEYKDLLFLFVKRDFISKYKQTILGPVWFIMQPLVYTVVFTIVFGKVAKLSTAGIPQILFYFSGMLAWQYFAQTLDGVSNVFINNASLFRKVYFPRLVMPLSVILSNIISYLLTFITFIGFYLYYLLGDYLLKFKIQLNVIFLPFVVIHTALLALGAGLLFSSLTVKYRDFIYISAFLKQLWMYATVPLFTDTSSLPERYKLFMWINPVCPLVEWYRNTFFGISSLSISNYLFSIFITLLILIIGLLLFSRVESTLVDTL